MDKILRNLFLFLANNRGMMVTLDHLVEFVDSEREANIMADYCVKTLEAITEEKVDGRTPSQCQFCFKGC